MWGKSRHWCILCSYHQFFCILLTVGCAPVVFIPLHFHPSLHTYRAVSPVGLGLFWESGSLSSSTSYQLSRRSFISSWVVSWIRVSRASDPITSSHLSFFFSLSLNTCVSLTYLMNLTHLWTQCNSRYTKSSCFMKIYRCRLLVILLPLYS